MASTTLTPGPRLALGTLDVNKHLGQSPAAGSPKKHSASLIHENKQSMAATKETRSPARSVSPELESNASDRSPLGSSKRKARDDDEDARRAKFARLESDHEDLHDLSVQYMSDEKENTPNIQLDDPQALAASSQGTLRPSPSPSPSFIFDIADDSHNTTMTEPEDVEPLATAAAAIFAQLPTTMSQQEVRERAQALKLRLRVAMYKVKTNQTDIPMSELEILPSRRSRASTRQDVNMEEASGTGWEITSSPPRSASPPPRHEETHREFATPVLPRSRNGLSHLGAHAQDDSPEFQRMGYAQDLTSSVVKGRAADGLLSLMGAIPL